MKPVKAWNEEKKKYAKSPPQKLQIESQPLENQDTLHKTENKRHNKQQQQVNQEKPELEQVQMKS